MQQALDILNLLQEQQPLPLVVVMLASFLKGCCTTQPGIPRFMPRMTPVNMTLLVDVYAALANFADM